MAAKKKSKKSASQQLMSVATMGLPAPVQKVATSKWGSKILMLLLPALLARRKGQADPDNPGGDNFHASWSV